MLPIEKWSRKYSSCSKLKTSSRTQPIKKLIKADKIITGAFVNASAIVKHIKNNNYEKVTFICTDSRWNDNEDFKLAEFVKNLTNNDKNLNKEEEFAKIKQHMINHPAAAGFLKTPLTEYSKEDFELAFNLDKFDFVINIENKNGKLVNLEKIS